MKPNNPWMRGGVKSEPSGKLSFFAFLFNPHYQRQRPASLGLKKL
jgi:hypothetical protein